MEPKEVHCPCAKQACAAINDRNRIGMRVFMVISLACCCGTIVLLEPPLRLSLSQRVTLAWVALLCVLLITVVISMSRHLMPLVLPPEQGAVGCRSHPARDSSSGSCARFGRLTSVDLDVSRGSSRPTREVRSRRDDVLKEALHSGQNASRSVPQLLEGDNPP